MFRSNRFSYLAHALTLLLGVGSANVALAAQQCDGTGDSWQIDNPNKGNVSTYSICAWLKPTASPSSPAVLFGYGKGITGSAGTGWDIVLRTDMTLRWNGYSAGSNFNSASSVTLTAGSWQHVCFVREGLFAHKIYIDATDATADQTLAIDAGDAILSTDDFVVATALANDNASYANYTGGMAQVAYYDAALTGSEVASLADKSTCPDAVATHSANLQVFLKMTDGAAVDDSSANAFTVTEAGNPTDDTGPGSLACDSGGTTTTTSSTTVTTTTSTSTTTTTIPVGAEIPCNGLDDDSSGGDLACTDDNDSDGDGYDDNHDCADADATIYPGVSIASGCTGSDYKTCQADGTYTSCQAGPLCEKTGSGQCYYVNPASGSDANPGTYASPWATLNNVSYYSTGAPGTAITPVAGSVFYLVGSTDLTGSHGGCYGGSHTCAFSTYNRNGTSSDHFTLKRYPGATLKINSSCTSGSPCTTIEYYYSDYWDFVDLELTGGYGSLIAGGEGVSNVKFERIYAHDNDGDANNNLAGIMMDGVDTAEIRNSRIKDICDSTASSTTKWYNVRNIGMFLSSNVTIHHNNIWHTLGPSDSGACKGRGIGQKHAVLPASAGTNRIYANKLWNNYDQITVASPNTETDHNLIICKSSDDLGYAEISGNGGPNTYHYLKSENFHHNTLYNCLGPTLNYEAGARSSTYIGNNTYQYNVIVNDRASYNYGNSLFTVCADVGCSDADYTAIYGGGLNTIDYNCYYASATTAKFGHFGGGSAASGGTHEFATGTPNWQGRGYDAHGYLGDPNIDSQYEAQTAQCASMGYTEGSMLIGTTTTTTTTTTTIPSSPSFPIFRNRRHY